MGGTPDWTAVSVGYGCRSAAGPAPGADDPGLYGEFGLSPDTRLADLARAYPVTFAAPDADLTLGALCRRELAGGIEPGDRVPLGAVDVIVRRMSEDNEIEEVGLAMEQVVGTRPRIPLFQPPAEITALMRGWFGRKRKAGMPKAPPADEGETPRGDDEKPS